MHRTHPLKTAGGILLYASGDDACPANEHEQIVSAIMAGRGKEAAEIMLHHLGHIEKDLKLDDEHRPEIEIASALDWLSGRAKAV